MSFSAGKCSFFVFSLPPTTPELTIDTWTLSIMFSQATLLRVLLYLKHAVLNVIPLALANLIKSVPTFMGELLRHHLK